MEKPRWPRLQQESSTPDTTTELLPEPATKQTLDSLLAIQMRLELATSVPVAIYGPTGQQLPGISPALARSSEQHVPPAREVLAADQWPQRSGQLLAVTWGKNLHFFVTPVVLSDHTVAQVVLGPLQLFDPGQQDGLASGRAAPARPKTIVGVPVLSVWRAHAVAEITTLIVSLYSNQINGEAEQRRQAALRSALQEEATVILPVVGGQTRQDSSSAQYSPAGRRTPDGQRTGEGFVRLGSLAENARLSERTDTGTLAGGQAHQTSTLQERMKLLSALVEALPQAVLICSAPGGQIMLANRAARAFWPDLLGEPGSSAASSSKRLYLEDYPPAWAGLSQALRQGVAIYQGQISIELPAQKEAEKPDELPTGLRESLPGERNEAAPPTTVPVQPTWPGTPRLPLLVSSFPLRDASGEVSHAVAIFEDVSSLLEREAFKDALVVHAAHDARNPLTIISSAAQLLERVLARDESPQAPTRERECRWLADIQEQVHLLAKHTDHLSLLVHLQQARSTSQSDPFNLARLVQQAVVDQHVLTPERRIEATVEHDPCIVQGSTLQVQHILSHLLKNAVKHSRPETPISVSLSCTPERAPLWAEISVRDQGVGIPRASLPHLFERFYQVPHTRERRLLAAQASPLKEEMGLGLGLYLCKQLIEHLGGQIWMESLEGQGTTVKLLLPLKK